MLIVIYICISEEHFLSPEFAEVQKNGDGNLTRFGLGGLAKTFPDPLHF